VFDFHLRYSGGGFPVQRPGQRLLSGNSDAGYMPHDKAGVAVIKFLKDQGPKHIVEGGKGLGFRDQKHLEFSIIHNNVLVIELEKPADRSSIGNRAKKEAAIKYFTVRFNASPVVAQSREV